MAEFASSLINSLASAVLREFARIKGLTGEVERLEEKVETSRAVLLDLDEKQKQSNTEQNLVKRLKNVLIPADDLLDEFLIQDMIHKRDEPHQNKVEKVLNIPFSLIKFFFIADEIEKIQKKLDDVLKDTSGYNLNPNGGVVQKTNIEWRETSPRVIESDIIGREGDKEKILNLLRQPHGDQNVSFVAIFGIGGLGKTTLAQLAYNDDVVRKFFEKIMWVCVSDNFDIKTIVRNMVKSLLPKEKVDDTLTLQNLEDRLHDNLASKKYLLVLDDVWNESSEEWNKLRPTLSCGAQGSKVLVTTRLKTVAQTMGVSDPSLLKSSRLETENCQNWSLLDLVTEFEDFRSLNRPLIANFLVMPYVLKGLTQEKSWNLLKKIAFMDDTIGVDQTFESIGNKIVEKCKGVPLAIRSLGNILQSKSEQKEWNDVLKGDFWKLCEDKDSILPILKLSYNNLLPQQRQCFAYCSLFPKDWEFEKDELIHMWMAHGYLDCPVKGKCMEDLGNQFVNTFLMKSFFQEAKWNKDGDIIVFKMHDLMHDLAKQVAGDDCCYLDNNAKGFQERPVHVSVECDALDLLKSLDPSRLRTLIVFSSNFNCLLDGEKQSIISTFKYLRVLKVCNCERMICVSVEKLKHLRFLDFHQSNILESLHKSIGNLICLQTIKVKLHAKVVLSTKFVSKLINLRHLEIWKWTFGDKTRPVGNFFGWLSPLTHIIEITLTYCHGFQYLPPLERLPFLKLLVLSSLDDLEYIYYKELILHEPFFPSLKRLYIRYCNKLLGWKKMGDDFKDINTSSSHHLLLPQFPCLSFLKISECPMLTHLPTCPNIKNLTSFINIANLPQYWWQNLTSLENLEFVDLSSHHFQTIEIRFKDDINYLPSLQKITFSSCYDLKALPDWICNISSLQHIKTVRCRDLACLPEGMTRLTNLHTLEIIQCYFLIEECEEETSATWPKIAHIPKIILDSDW